MGGWRFVKVLITSAFSMKNDAKLSVEWNDEEKDVGNLRCESRIRGYLENYQDRMD